MTATACEAKEGKYLTFTLGKEEYGLEILKVREIIGYMTITSVPQTPKSIKGVINLRGQVIPIMDLRLRFDMNQANITDKTCIIVVEAFVNDTKTQVGMIVDSVSEVLDIEQTAMEGPPEFGSDIERSFILAMAKIGTSVKILLNIDKVLSNVSFTALDEHQHEHNEVVNDEDSEQAA